MDRAIKLLSTGLFAGYSPFAPGTCGTVVGVGLFWLVRTLPPVHYALFLLVFILFSCWVSDRAQAFFGEDDPRQVTIDEIAGFLVTMFLHPWSVKAVIAGFILFRFFDIVKPPPVRQIDRRMRNGIGIVLDDVAAGVYANVCLCVAARFI
jgi:phosphatidylglycerophosphatase A